MRLLKKNERRLLKKVNLYHYRGADNARELDVLSRFKIADRREYEALSRLVGDIRRAAAALVRLDAGSPTRARLTRSLLDRLYDAGFVERHATLADLEHLPVAALARRRLAVVAAAAGLAPSVGLATRFIEHGHVRVGIETVTNPSLLVPRTVEDYVTWTATSSIRAKVDEYHGRKDDFLSSR